MTVGRNVRPLRGRDGRARGSVISSRMTTCHDPHRDAHTSRHVGATRLEVDDIRSWDMGSESLIVHGVRVSERTHPFSIDSTAQKHPFRQDEFAAALRHRQKQALRQAGYHRTLTHLDGLSSASENPPTARRTFHDRYRL